MALVASRKLLSLSPVTSEVDDRSRLYRLGM